jgi:hypothetical protein
MPPGTMPARPASPRVPVANPTFVEISDDAEAGVIAGARSVEPVRGLTHSFYRYPARFSNAFARAAIEAFTKPGDLVLDPHVGGGTSLVEAMALGRDAVGVDISALAEFVTTAKTTLYSECELDVLAKWAERLPKAVDVNKISIHFADYHQRGYYKHLDHADRWRIRKAIEQALGSALKLPGRLEDFGRSVVLKTAQLALDGRKDVVPVPALRAMLAENAREMIEGARDFQAAVTRHTITPEALVLNRSAAGLEDDERVTALRAPRLVVTSPPYPGVHVLYHRWQVGGGRETAAPFWIARKLDGAGSSYYTMGDRKYPELKTYFDAVRRTMSSVAALADKRTVFVQMLAFSDPSWQLPRYLETMEDAGLSEVLLPSLEGERDGRLWRAVPNRKWYSDQRGETPGSQEVVLIHRLRDTRVATLPGQPGRSRRCPRRRDRPSSGSSAAR